MLFKKNKRPEVHLAQYLAPRQKRRWWPKALVALFFILLAASSVLLPLFYGGWKIYGRLSAVNDRVDKVMSAAGNGDFKSISAYLGDTRSDLLAIRADAGKLGPILWWPSIAKTYRTADQMLSATADLLDGYGELISVFTDLQGTTDEGEVIVSFADQSGKKKVLESIVKNRSNLEDAKAKIAKAKSQLHAANTDDLTGAWKDKVIKANNLLGEIIEQSETALPLFKYLPELAGYNHDRTYLVLFENNMELRPTGGFIGSYGLVTLRDGAIKSIVTDDIYNLDKLSKDKLRSPAPWPMEKYNNQKYLFMRDANWSPDWPTAAKELKWFFDIERQYAGLPPQELDGIVAITPDFISNFLQVTGPITVDGITFTSENFALELERQVEFEYEEKGLELHERKQIIGDLTAEIIKRLEKSDPSDLLRVWSVMKKNINQKHIIAWLSNQELQQYFSDQNWAGEVKRPAGDYVFIVDSNFAALKTDQVMQRSLDYFVGPDQDGNLVARAEITYKHSAKPVKYLVTKYRTYTRVYLPEKTQVAKVYLKSGNDVRNFPLGSDAVISEQLGKTEVGVFFEVEPLTSKTLVLEYRLPESVNQAYKKGDYSLLLQ